MIDQPVEREGAAAGRPVAWAKPMKDMKLSVAGRDLFFVMRSAGFWVPGHLETLTPPERNLC